MSVWDKIPQEDIDAVLAEIELEKARAAAGLPVQHKSYAQFRREVMAKIARGSR